MERNIYIQSLEEGTKVYRPVTALEMESKINDFEGLQFVEQEIELLFSEIRKTSNLNEADLLFKNLEDIQFILAKAIFKNGIIATPFLREFVYDFDRIDDLETKVNLYSKIKQQSPI